LAIDLSFAADASGGVSAKATRIYRKVTTAKAFAVKAEAYSEAA
jgi:hypothetical protein